jgi:hypothetical protein
VQETTYDWALDLEPLALPPDLPPVILKVVWGFGKVGSWECWELEMGVGRAVGGECRDDGLLAGGGGRRQLIRTARACCGARDQLAG